jgi:lipopolysaccharide export system protein LptA
MTTPVTANAARLGPAALFALLLLAAPAWAERADRDKPMQIEADAMRYEDQKQLSTFTGHVVVTKGTIVLRGGQLEVRQDAEGNQYGLLRAEPGKRAFFRQKREGLDEYIEGEGNTIDYDGKSDTMHIVGNAEMRRLAGATLQDRALGAVIVYNNTTGVYTVDGPVRAGGQSSAAPGERVSVMLTPRQQPASAAARGAANAASAAAPAAAGPRLRPSRELPRPAASRAGASR